MLCLVGVYSCLQRQLECSRFSASPLLYAVPLMVVQVHSEHAPSTDRAGDPMALDLTAYCIQTLLETLSLFLTALEPFFHLHSRAFNVPQLV